MTTTSNATKQVFQIAELLEFIILHLFDSLDHIDQLGDASLQSTLLRAQQLTSTLLVSRVSRRFNDVFRTSVRLRRRLFLLPDRTTSRSWQVAAEYNKTDSTRKIVGCADTNALPLMNPFIHVELSDFPFRFWSLSSTTTGNAHCAFMIISRDNLIKFRRRHLQSGRETTVVKMLLSQPPCKALQCDIFEDRDETREYVGRTTNLQESLIVCDTGLTIGFVCNWLSRMFSSHTDVGTVKLRTIRHNVAESTE